MARLAAGSVREHCLARVAPPRLRGHHREGRPPEVDFAARRQEHTIYVQVATTIASAETRRREYAPLEAIPDNYPKYVLTLDPLAGDNTGGIHHLPIHDFLLSGTY